jgi:PAT family beta-lactamase induction signal transducer AmpG
VVLTESRPLRFVTFFILYVAQGLPFGMVSVALPAYLAEAGRDPAEIASFATIASLPWIWKLLAAPMMDRWTWLSMGRRRPWVIITLSGLVIVGIAFAFFPNGLENLVVLTSLCFLLNAFAASQDVAVDGMAIDVLKREEHGRANAFMAFGQTAGIAGCGIVAAYAVNYFGMPGIAVMLCIGFGLILAVAIAVRERPGEKLLPWTEGQATRRSVEMKPDSWWVVIRDLLRVMLLPASLLMICVAILFRFADGFWITLAPIVAVQEFGVNNITFSKFVSQVSFIAAAVGIGLGLIIDKKGIRVFYGTAMALYGGIALYVGLSDFSSLTTTHLITIVILQALVFQGVFIGMIASSMNLCWARVAATQFATYMTMANVGRLAGQGALVALDDRISYNQMYLVIACVFFVGAVLVWVTGFRKHRETVLAFGGDKESESAVGFA